MAEQKPERVYMCPRCGGWFVAKKGPRLSCTVMHPEGQCCHYGEEQEQVPTPGLGAGLKAYYHPWACGCCGFVNGEQVCLCAARGLRSDPMDLTSTRLCSVCGQCSIHCPHNHTAGASSGWELPTLRLI